MWSWRACARFLVAVVAAVSAAAASARAAVAADGVTCDARTLHVGGLLSTWHIGGTYCRPATGMPAAMVVMVPGGTYSRVYWDFPYKRDTYSFSRAMARSGYATFALDRLGTGESSKPLSATVLATTQAGAVHDVIARLRSSGFDGQAFPRVLLAGHSLGSIISVIEAATYRDVDGVVVTGLTHKVDPVAAAKLFGVELYPAMLDPALSDRGPDPGYLTTRPGLRYEAFYAGTVDPGVVATDEQTKDVFSVAELPDGLTFAVVLPYAARIDAPVLIGMGQQDQIFCTPLATDCSSRAALVAEERPYYAGAPCLDAVVMPGVGHDVNLHPSAPEFQAKVIAWADAVTSGGCPSG